MFVCGALSEINVAFVFTVDPGLFILLEMKWREVMIQQWYNGDSRITEIFLLAAASLELEDSSVTVAQSPQTDYQSAHFTAGGLLFHWNTFRDVSECLQGGKSCWLILVYNKTQTQF